MCVSSSWARSFACCLSRRCEVSGPATTAAASRFRSGDGGGSFSVSDFQFWSECEGVHVKFVMKLGGVGIGAIPKFAVLVNSKSVVREFLETVIELDGEAGGWGEKIKGSCRSGGLGRCKVEG